MVYPWLCCCSLAAAADSEVNTISLLWLEYEFYCTTYSLMRYEIKTVPSHCKGCISTLDSNECVRRLPLPALFGERERWSGWRLLYKSLMWMSFLAVEFVVIRWGFLLTPWVWPDSFHLIYVRGQCVMQLCYADDMLLLRMCSKISPAVVHSFF